MKHIKKLALCLIIGLIGAGFSSAYAYGTIRPKTNNGWTYPSSQTNWTFTQTNNFTPRKIVYQYAQSNNQAGLRYMLYQGYSLDMIDEKGNTPLCEAVWHGNWVAYQVLMSYGADVDAPCMQKIPDPYKARLGLSNVGSHVYPGMSNKTPRIKSDSGSGEKILSYGLTAALIGGGIALIASNLGGSGDSVKHSTGCLSETALGCSQCAEGYILGDDKICYLKIPGCIDQLKGTCQSCQSGYELKEGQCKPTIHCPENQYSDGNQCQHCPEQTTSTAGSVGIDSCKCESGYGLHGTTTCHLNIPGCIQQMGDTCESCSGKQVLSTDKKTCYPFIDGCKTQTNDTCSECNEGYNLTGNTCEKISCDEGTYRQGNQCLSCGEHATSASGSESIDDCYCLSGYVMTNHICYPEIEHCVKQDANLCTQCEGNWSGNDCKACSLTGTDGAVDSATCQCKTGYSQNGTTCIEITTTCEEGYYAAGDTCLTCQHGTSPGGKIDACNCPTGTGWSGADCGTCSGHWTSTECNQCQGSWTGDDCNTCSLSGAEAYFDSANCQCKTGAHAENGVCVKNETTCEADYYQDGENCVPCPAGSHSPAGSTGFTSCVCESGDFYNTQECHPTIEHCKEGHQTGDTCDECESDEYELKSGYCVAKGQQTCDDTHQYLKEETCQTCQNGGTAPNPTATSCTCTGNWSGDDCSQCTLEGDHVDTDSCSCTGDTHPNDEKTACVTETIICDPNFYIKNGQCTACQHGGTTEGQGAYTSCSCPNSWTGNGCEECTLEGDHVDTDSCSCTGNTHPNDEKTACVTDATTCTKNNYLKDGNCLPCQNEGTTPGDGTYTSCTCTSNWAGEDCSKCSVGFYLDGTSCTQCPEGSTSPEGSTDSKACQCETGKDFYGTDTCHTTIEHCQQGKQQGDTCSACETGYILFNNACTQENVSYTGSSNIYQNGTKLNYRLYSNTTDYALNTSALKSKKTNLTDADFKLGRALFAAQTDTSDSSVVPTLINQSKLTLTYQPPADDSQETQEADENALKGQGYVLYSDSANLINQSSGTIKMDGVSPYANAEGTLLGSSAMFLDYNLSSTTDSTPSVSLQNEGTITLTTPITSLKIINDSKDATKNPDYPFLFTQAPFGDNAYFSNDALVAGITVKNTNLIQDNISGTHKADVMAHVDLVTGINSGTINVKQGTGAIAVASTFENRGNITVEQGIGIVSQLAKVTNSGTIKVGYDSSGNVKTSGRLPESESPFSGSGIVANGSDVINTATGKIYVVDGYGIYARGYNQTLTDYTTIKNEGLIEVKDTNMAAIYVEGKASIINTGTLKVGSTSQTGLQELDNILIKKDADAVVEFNNSGTLASNLSLNLNSLNFTAQKGSTTRSDISISGLATIGKDVVQNGFKTAYIEPNMFDAPDTSELKVASESALFNASLADNGSDVVMTKKDFGELTENKSLAKFLEQNYALENNEAFYNELKAIDSTSAFKSGLNSLTGMDTLGRFAYEDLTAVREMNLAMNNQMFANDEKNIFTTQGSVNNFSFKNGEASSGQFALGNRKVSPNLRVGYAMSVTRVNTNDEANDNTRHSTIFQMALPFNYNTKGLKMISTPMAGFARGHYNRNGLNDMTYDGIIEKRMFGLMNEVRYPFKVAGFELSPTVELNAIAYNQKGGEENKPYSLTIQSDNNLSVEAGVGMYAAKDYTFGKDAKLNLNAGLMLYREFADPYNMKLGMQGMSGSFDLYDDNRSDYRGVASFGLDYKAEDLDIYGAIQHYMEDESHTNVKSGVKLKF